MLKKLLGIAPTATVDYGNTTKAQHFLTIKKS